MHRRSDFFLALFLRCDRISSINDLSPPISGGRRPRTTTKNMELESSVPRDLDQMPEADLRSLQQEIHRALSLKGAKTLPSADAIPEVIRINMHRYKASIAGVAPLAAKENLTAAHSRPVLGISLGSQNMEGPKFEACVAWIAENFPSCVLLVGDAIYHYTLNVTRGVPLEEAKTLAIEAGKAFMEKYEPVVRRYRTQCAFEWVPLSRTRENPRFETYRDHFEHLYATVPHYRTSVDDFSLMYLDRVLTRKDGALPEDWRDQEPVRNARRYLVEESAMFTCLCEEGAQALLYPGSIKTFEEIAEGKVPEVPEPMKRMVFVALRLNKGGLYLGHDASGWVGSASDAAGQGFLSDFTEEQWQRFMRYTLRQKYRPGDIVVREGDRDRTLSMLLEGTCEVLVATDATGRMKQVARHSKGSVFGEMSFVDGRPRSATVAAMDDCEMLLVTQKKFELMKEHEPHLALAMMEDIATVLSLRYRQELEAARTQ